MFKLLAKKTDRAFTILECLFAIVLVGIAVAALVAGNGSFTRVNSAAVELSTAEYLIQQIKELTDLLPGTDPDFSYMTFVASNDYDDVDDFNGYTRSVDEPHAEGYVINVKSSSLPYLSDGF